MRAPRPPSLRLVTRPGAGARGRPPRPPLDLDAWDADAPALAVLLDASGADVNDPAQLAVQIPHARELPPATPLFVLGSARRGGSLWSWLGLGRIPVGRAARCTALVARGYVRVAAAVDEATCDDLAWGFSSPG